MRLILRKMEDRAAEHNVRKAIGKGHSLDRLDPEVIGRQLRRKFCRKSADRVDRNRICVGGEDFEAVDTADAAALYKLIEDEIVPAYYDRDANGVPHRWIAIVKESIRTVAPRFSARRMVKEYVERMYAPGLDRKLQVSR